jgi:2-oxoglutarate ferredoxin oxidoreductase subunit beta
VTTEPRPDAGARTPLYLGEDFAPRLVLRGTHELCPGCGEPVALRALLEAVEHLGLATRTVLVAGIGCSTALVPLVDLEVLQALHGRAPSLATGLKRARPDLVVATLQGDGDMADEGLQEVLHTAARAEPVTCVMLNNGVFGETGGHMTATTVLGQRTKTSLEGRDPRLHGYPIPVAELVAVLPGAAYVARGAVDRPGNVARTTRMLERALEVQRAGTGFGLVEILTMCPTGWFVEPAQGPSVLSATLARTHRLGVIKDAAPGAPAPPSASEEGA